MQSKLSVAGTIALVVLSATRSAHAAGSVSGYGRFEKIAGVPSMGYQHLYEWDLFLSPADNSMVGPCRRLGAPPGQTPTNDGYYRIDGLPAGTYSLLLNQPDFFASPKVLPNVQIADGQVTIQNIDLDVDYSTYFTGSNQWTEWQDTWYQTFMATGTAVRAVSWKMAGWGLYSGKSGHVTILQDDGDPDVRNWTPLGTGSDTHIASDSDEWVRWPSGQIPITPGKRHAIKVQVDGGCAIYKRNKDAGSYPQGRAYDRNGSPMGFDLNITLFVDKNGQLVTHTRLGPGPGDFDGGLSDTRWGQSFVATGTSLAAVDLFAASTDQNFDLTWKIRESGPAGPQIGPTKMTQGAYFASSTDLVGVSFNPNEVALIPGQTYYIEITDSQGFTPFVQPAWNRYPDGAAFRSGALTGHDLAMTIIEYALAPQHKQTDLNGDKKVDFYDFCVFAWDWLRQADGLQTDLNWDMIVNAGDLLDMTDDWLKKTGVPPRSR